MAQFTVERPNRGPWLVLALLFTMLLGGGMWIYGAGRSGYQLTMLRQASVAQVRLAPHNVAGNQGPHDVPTRLLVNDTPWARKAAAALQRWRSTLFGRMAEYYKWTEAAVSNNGSVPVHHRVEPKGIRRYDLMNPFIDCPVGNLTRVGGTGDGSKLICMDKELQEPGCVVYSLGSNGQYEFEEAMLAETQCDVHTFDCTWDGKSLGPRHFYHKICVGEGGPIPKAGEDAKFMKYDKITAMLNHTRVDLLKIDIEGFEFDVFSGFEPTCTLPMQIAMEVHFVDMYNSIRDPRDFSHLYWPLHDVSMGELAVFFFHLADMGYGVVNREDNVEWGLHCCAEFTLVRTEKPVGCRRR